MSVGLAALLALALTAQAAAGAFFRLEVGGPIAAGLDSKMKNFKKAVLVVRPLVCDDAASVRITGTAEGIVDGRRQSIPLTLVPLQSQGIHAVQREWPDAGQWVLHLAATCPATKAAASTLVPLTKTGFNRDRTQVLTEPATKAQVEAALKSVTAPGSGS